jgi:hypothetical protein
MYNMRTNARPALGWLTRPSRPPGLAYPSVPGIVVGHTDYMGGALPKVDLQWHVADFITGFVPDHDAQMIPCGCASRQISCN